MLIHKSLIEKLVTEDAPYGDITTEAMGIAGVPGVMEFRARYGCVCGGLSEAAEVLRYLGAKVETFVKSGDRLSAKAEIMRAEADAGVLHAGWKVAQNIMEHATGIATRTRAMVDNGRKANPNLVVACTRKSFPGGKTICMNAVQAGGGTPHRLGVSETFLLFDNHASFFDSEEELLAALGKAAVEQPERKLAVECESLDYAVKAAENGALIIQFDKIGPKTLVEWVPVLRERFPDVTLAAAGGINTDSVEEFASTGIDVAVTSYVYTGKPMDIEVKIRKA